MPFAFAARTTSATLSAPPMLPGLMRTAATPWSIAFSARLALKWMSAMIGTGENRTIFPSASASSVFGTATRTISHPADASSAICAVVAGTSCVFVVVIDWTTTGAPPPIATPPTVIWRLLAIASSVRTGLFHLAEDAARVAVEGDEEHEDHQRHPNERHAFVHLARNRAPADALDEREEDVSAVERQERDEIKERERDADEREDLEVPGDADPQGLGRVATDPDDGGQVGVRVRLDEGRQTGHRAGRHAPGVRDGTRQRLGEGVSDGGQVDPENPMAIAPDGLSRSDGQLVSAAQDAER